MISTYTSAIGSLVILAVTVVISLLALYATPKLITDFVFRPHELLPKKKYDTLYMSGFIHGSLGHLLLNMISLCFFAFTLEHRIGTTTFVILYFLGLIASLIPSWYFHHEDPAYATLGASGAVAAVIFAYIVYFPNASLFIMPVPVPIPAPLYALGYVLYSWFSSKHAKDNINHGAHIAGGLFGIVFVMATDYPAFQQFLSYLNHLVGSL
jgi:membrane associated rhomboid family serine protease